MVFLPCKIENKCVKSKLSHVISILQKFKKLILDYLLSILCIYFWFYMVINHVKSDLHLWHVVSIYMISLPCKIKSMSSNIECTTITKINIRWQNFDSMSSKIKSNFLTNFYANVFLILHDKCWHLISKLHV